MIRVLHVVNGFQFGGVETQLLRVLTGYDRSRFHMDACIIGDEPGTLAHEARACGADLFSCHKSPDLWSFSRRFSHLCQGRGYHVVHSHFETWSGAILRGARSAGVPVRIAHFHSSIPWQKEHTDPFWLAGVRALVQLWGRYWDCCHATHVLAVSRAVMDSRQLRCRFTAPDIGLWTGGVDTAKFSPATAVARDPLDPPRMIWVGGLRPVKRVDLHLHIFRSVLAAVPHAELWLVGTGNQQGHLVELAGKLGITRSVKFLGLREDIPDLLRSATVFVSCSEAEGLPTVLLEAQACGLPVIARDIGPHREAIAPELQPYLFHHDSLEAAAQNIVRILRDGRLRSELGRAGRDFVLARYDAASQLDVLQNRYVSWVERSRAIAAGS